MAWSTAGLGLLLICVVALQPNKSFSEAAFAFGQWDNGGWASGPVFNYRTQAEAEIAAMNSCNQVGYNCSILARFRKLCFALAVQDGNNGFSYRTNINADTAERDALTSCVSMGRPCSLRARFCDSVSEAEVRAAEEAEYQQYVQQWYACFGRGSTLDEQINNCDYALNFRRASQNDRNQLLQRRSSLFSLRNQQIAAAQAAADAQKAAADARAQEEFHMYQLRWQHCFDLSALVSRIDGQIHAIMPWRILAQVLTTERN